MILYYEILQIINRKYWRAPKESIYEEGVLEKHNKIYSVQCCRGVWYVYLGASLTKVKSQYYLNPDILSVRLILLYFVDRNVKNCCFFLVWVVNWWESAMECSAYLYIQYSIHVVCSIDNRHVENNYIMYTLHIAYSMFLCIYL